MKTVYPFLFALVALTAGCSRDHRAATHSTHVSGIVAEANEKTDVAVSSEKHLEGAPRLRVDGYTDAPEFSVLRRTAVMQKFPCKKCHDKPLEVLRKAPDKKASHWDTKIVHAPAATMNCYTCHNEKDLDALATLNKTSVSMDRADQVCGQCHSRQAADWAGGAHGKRVGGWAPPRVVAGCAQCHNPHNPKLAPRWPAVAERRDDRKEQEQAQ